MSQLEISLWNDVLTRVEQELPSQAFETWFQPTRALECTENTFTIEVPNPFFRDWITTHYKEFIETTLSSLAQQDVTVVFSIAQKTKPVEAPKPEPPHQTTSESAHSPSETPKIWPAQNNYDPSESKLNPNYTFDEFVIGSSNRFAHAAALAITEQPARVYNPLFIYGGVGLGKTHLMQAIGNRMRERFPQAKCLYFSSERFTNQLISSIQNRSMNAFRERFRSADVLLIDDIHFIAGKESTQEVFFHTFNALYDAHKQIIISSDRPPKELRGVEERLISRFEWGLVTDIQKPDLETRVAILRKKAEYQGVQVDEAITLFIAERITSNIRELEGALNRVIAYSVLTGRDITLQMAEETLQGLVVEAAKTITLDRIQRIVANYFNLTPSDLRGKRRTKEISYPRQLAMAICREMTDASLPSIGEAFGGRDHATVLYACQKVSKDRKSDPKTNKLVENLMEELKTTL